MLQKTRAVCVRRLDSEVRHANQMVKLPNYVFLVAAYSIDTGLILDKLLETSSLTDYHTYQIFFFKVQANSLIHMHINSY